MVLVFIRMLQNENIVMIICRSSVGSEQVYLRMQLLNFWEMLSEIFWRILQVDGGRFKLRSQLIKVLMQFVREYLMLFMRRVKLKINRREIIVKIFVRVSVDYCFLIFFLRCLWMGQRMQVVVVVIIIGERIGLIVFYVR